MRSSRSPPSRIFDPSAFHELHAPWTLRRRVHLKFALHLFVRHAVVPTRSNRIENEPSLRAADRVNLDRSYALRLGGYVWALKLPDLVLVRIAEKVKLIAHRLERDVVFCWLVEVFLVRCDLLWRPVILPASIGRFLRGVFAAHSKGG